MTTKISEWLYLSLVLFLAVMLSLSVCGIAVDVKGRAREDKYLRGTWEQYCTQLLVQRNFRALMSSDGCRNTSIHDGANELILETQ